MKLKIKKNDNIEVIAGKEKGKRGKVLLVFPKEQRLIVEKINMIKRHTRPSQKTKQGGIVEREGKFHISNVLLMCSKCNRGVRVRYKILESGDRVRVCKKCGEELDKV
jgi:large subunit ribosomal protein L24